jgi:hypothetical protein
VSDNNDTRIGNRVLPAVAVQIEPSAKARRNLDTLFDNHTPKLRTFSDTNAWHQNGFVYRCPVLDLRTRRQDCPNGLRM